MPSYEIRMSDGPWIPVKEAETDGTSVWVRLSLGWKEFPNAADSDNIRIKGDTK